MALRVRIGEGAGQQPFLLWDSIWDPEQGFADWALAGFGNPLNRGGLQADNALHTAVVVALFTDRRVPDDHPLRWLAGDDPRGWWGDGVLAAGERPLGSLLWLLERVALTGTMDTGRWAESLATEALDVLIDQVLVVRTEVAATVIPLRDRLELVVRLYGRDGTRTYDQRFEIIWQQVQS